MSLYEKLVSLNYSGDLSPEIVSLAACVSMAAHCSRTSKTPNKVKFHNPYKNLWHDVEDSCNEIYWHTRDKLIPKTRELGIKLYQPIKLFQFTNFDSLVVDFFPDSINMFWDEICHPNILLAEVINT